MSGQFIPIFEEFTEELEAIRLLVRTFSDPQNSAPRARVAAANSATLLLAATFEEFIREMARAYAKEVVSAAASFEDLPTKIASTAWRRTMETLARMPVNVKGKNFAGDPISSDVLSRFTAVYEFCKGDLSQNIYQELIHNENNMRPGEINSLFKISDLKDICAKVSDKQPLLDFFGSSEPGKVHGQLIASLDDFFERRNAVAHSLSSTHSSGADQILRDINLLEAFGNAVCHTLEGQTSNRQGTSNALGDTAGGPGASANASTNSDGPAKKFFSGIAEMFGIRRLSED